MTKILVTGAAGFIGGNFVDWYHTKYPDHMIIGADAMTYAANPSTIQYFNKHSDKLLTVDLADEAQVRTLFSIHNFDAIFHFAAESHVCNSIETPRKFFKANVESTFNLLEELRMVDFKGRIINICTDEIYGELGPTGKFNENTTLAPTSPYSGTKACQKLLADVYYHTYGLDIINVAPSNNFGPRQHLEKLIPRVVKQILSNSPVTVYQSGTQIRDWLFVFDHCEAIDLVFTKGRAGDMYCIGGNKELMNLEMIREIHSSIVEATGVNNSISMVYTNDRPTDDLRYAIDTSKIEQLGWKPKIENFRQYLLLTVKSIIDSLKT